MTKKQNLKFLIRYEKVNGKNSPIIILPELTANNGFIVCYSHIGQHSECHIMYYKCNTKKADFNDSNVISLINEIKSIYHDCNLQLKKRLSYNDLNKNL